VQLFPVVEDLDVVRDGKPGPSPVREGLPVIHLALQRAEEALGGGVMPAHPVLPTLVRMLCAWQN
jgi:hypothetical protein